MWIHKQRSDYHSYKKLWAGIGNIFTENWESFVNKTLQCNLITEMDNAYLLQELEIAPIPLSVTMHQLASTCVRL